MTTDPTERPFRHLCPEADERDAMDDAEFWERVAANLGGDVVGPDDPDLGELDVTVAREPCPVCGEPSACGYDAEGRPMIHTSDTDEDDS